MNRGTQAGTAVLLAVIAGIAQAATDLTVVDSGFVTAAGGSSKFDAVIAPLAKYNYSVGWEEHYVGGGLKPPPFAFMERKNFFVVDLTVVDHDIIGASLILPMPPGGYTSPDAFEDFVLSDTPLSPAEIDLLDPPILVPGPGPGPDPDIDPGQIAHAMLVYDEVTKAVDDGFDPLATIALDEGTEGLDVEMVFTPAGLAFLNASKGSVVVMGGKLTTLPPGPGGPAEIGFAFTGPWLEAGPPPGAATAPPVLSLTLIPLPPALLLFTPALLVLLRRRAVAHRGAEE